MLVLLAGHGVILYSGWSHVTASGAVLSGAIILLLIRHLGVLSRLSAWFRERRVRDRL